MLSLLPMPVVSCFGCDKIGKESYNTDKLSQIDFTGKNIQKQLNEVLILAMISV